MKNPLTPAGIEPATFRFLAQHLNHRWEIIIERVSYIGPSGTELNPICHLLALLEAYCNL